MQKTNWQNQSRSSISRTAPKDHQSNMNLVLEHEKGRLSLRKKKLEEEIASRRGYGRNQTLNLTHSQAFEYLRQKEEDKLDDQLSISENENSEQAMTDEIEIELNKNRNIGQETASATNRSTLKPQTIKKEMLDSKENTSRSFEWNDSIVTGLALFLLILCFKEFLNLKGLEHPLLLNIGEMNALISFLLTKYYQIK